MGAIKVLVVDDSALMRRLITSILMEAGFEVATAHNGVEGVEQLLSWQPDVVTLDINMPKMDGLTALSLMMSSRPTPTIMVSSLTEQGALATLEALALGAVDYIAKPGGTISLSMDEIAKDLVRKVRHAVRAQLRARRSNSAGSGAVVASVASPPQPKVARRATPLPAVGLPLVLIGVSTGGPRTLEEVLPQLPDDFPAAVLIAQHMPVNFTQAFAQRMDRLCAMSVREVSAVMPLQAGHIYIGRGGMDMAVEKRLGRLVVVPRPESPVHPWHPSVDVLVESALQVLPASQLIGVQLTGMGSDGAQAMAQLKSQGGRTIAEDASTAIVFGMPQELIRRGGASLVLPIQAVAKQLRAWIKN